MANKLSGVVFYFNAEEILKKATEIIIDKLGKDEQQFDDLMRNEVVDKVVVKRKGSKEVDPIIFDEVRRLFLTFNTIGYDQDSVDFVESNWDYLDAITIYSDKVEFLMET